VVTPIVFTPSSSFEVADILHEASARIPVTIAGRAPESLADLFPARLSTERMSPFSPSLELPLSPECKDSQGC
jgi:hypothetical protein